MRKKELLAAIPKKWPEKDTAKIIKSGDEEALMILATTSGGRYSEPKRLAHFVSETRYMTYYPQKKAWTDESLSWIGAFKSCAWFDFDKKGCEAIKKFTGSNYSGSVLSVESWESHISFSKRQRALERKQDRIDAFMKGTPALPKDFRPWCKRTLGDRGCIYVKLYQYYEPEKVMERIFRVENATGWYKDAYDSRTKGFCMTEICRAYTDGCVGKWDHWYYGEMRGAYGRNQRFWDRKNLSVVNVLPQKHYLYDNLDDLDLTPGERSTLRIMSGLADPSVLLNVLRRYPQIEGVVKSGLLRITSELLLRNIDLILKDIAQLSKTQRKRLIDAGGGIDAARLLLTFPNITDRNLKVFSRIKSTNKASSILRIAERGLNMNHVMTLWKKTGGMKEDIIDKYRDYIAMAERLGHNIHEEIIYRNKNWLEWHDRYTEEINRERNRKRDASDNRRYTAIRKDYARNTALFSWKCKGYVIMVPKNAEAINREGRMQHHCVGGAEYKEKMARRKSYIVFLRKADKPDTPYYTVECTEGRVLQFYAAYDRKPDEKKVSAVLAEWMKQVRKNAKKATA